MPLPFLCLQVIWFHNERPVKESKDFQLLFEGDRCSLVINEVYLEDSGEYKCAARNVHGYAESKCRLIVERKCIDFVITEQHSKLAILSIFQKKSKFDLDDL